MEPEINKPSMLVIEDNLDTQGIYKDVFEREGFNVLVAADGEKGLYYAQTTNPDIILLDLMLPKISGFNILKRLRAQEETQRIPIMVFSAREFTSDLLQAGDQGLTEYAAKALNSPKIMVGRVLALLAKAKNLKSSSGTVCPTCHRAF
jgi:DNA-binding response OmpR family regulator